MSDQYSLAATSPPDLLTLKLICAQYVPVAERTLWRWIAAEKFPRPDISMGSKARFWRRETVLKWIEDTATSSQERR